MGGLKSLIAVAALACCNGPATAHEFWVAAEDYMPQQGARIVAALKVGQMMQGADFPYLSNRFHAFTVTTRDGTRDATGFEGDIPALAYQADPPGLHVIAYHATPDLVTFDKMSEFVDYLDYEGLGAIAAAHRARGLPEEAITEAYTRYAKALVQVGPVTEEDREAPLGLLMELVAGANPYRPERDRLPVTLTWRGVPLADRQIAVFRDDGEVSRTLVTTDATGSAMISLAGGGEFLLSAVHIEPVENDDVVVWASHWASLTFGLPPTTQP